MASSAYAATSDLGSYLESFDQTANATIATTLLNYFSRMVDEKTGQHFYDDGFYTIDIDGEGENKIPLPFPMFYSAGTIASCTAGATSVAYTPSALAPSVPQANDKLTLDTGNTLREVVTISSVSGSSAPYTLNLSGTGTANGHASGTIACTLQIEIAYFENQPLNQRIVTLDGDGVTPPSNFYVWPRTRKRVATVADTTSRWPWYFIDIATIPISGTTYLPSTIPGNVTVRISAHWGWPVVPEIVKNTVLKATARAWRARGAGYAGQVGSPEVGTQSLSKFFDGTDYEALCESGLVIHYI